MSIYVVTHLNNVKIREPGYSVIRAGAANVSADVSASGEKFVCDFRDDEGPDNISERNSSFCELTAVYWLWKNCQDEWIGITHYRRFFSNRWSSREILSVSDAEKILKSYDIILPQIAFQKVSMRDEFVRKCGTYEDLDILRDIVAGKAPDYLEAFDCYFSGEKTCFMNMMICGRELFRKYCSWLFPILFEMEKRVDLSGRSAYQKRLFGFLGERLLNIFVMKNRLKSCHLFLLETDRKLSLPMDLCYRLARTGAYRLQMAGRH